MGKFNIYLLIKYIYSFKKGDQKLTSKITHLLTVVDI